MGVFSFVDAKTVLKQGHKIIPMRWVFKYKFDEDGTLEKLKSRLCARGDKQEATAK